MGSKGDQCRDAAILEHVKQEFVTCGIPKLVSLLNFVKSTEKYLGGWKRKDKYEMRNDVVCYCYCAVLSSCVSH